MELDTATVELDSDRFDELVRAAEAPGLDVHQRLALLDEALGLWRGGAYEEVADQDWARSEAARLNEMRVTASERRFEAMLAAGMHTDAIADLAVAADAHPLRDRLAGLRMLALFRAGRQAEAAGVPGSPRPAGRPVGAEAGTELVELDRRIVAGEVVAAALHSVGTTVAGLPIGEQLGGGGAFAVVYRGTQPSVGAMSR